MEVPGLDLDVYFGGPESPEPDWRAAADANFDEPTPEEAAEVAGLLGFDPASLWAADPEGDETTPDREAAESPPPRAKSLAPSPFLGRKAIVQKKDKIGRRLCYEDTTGKRVACGPAPKASAKKPDNDKKTTDAGGSPKADGEPPAKETAPPPAAKPAKPAAVRKPKAEAAKPAAAEPPFPQQDPDDPAAKAIREDAASRQIVASLASDPGYEKVKMLDRQMEEGVRLYQIYKRNPTKRNREAWLRLPMIAPSQRDKVMNALAAAGRAKLKEAMRPAKPLKVQASMDPGLKTSLTKEQWEKIIPNTPYPEDGYTIKPYIPSDEDKAAIETALDFVQSITQADGYKPELQFRKSLTGRAGFNTSTAERPRKLRFARLLLGDKEPYQKNTLSMGLHFDKESTAATVVHELGHLIDETKPGVKAKVEAFLKYRLGDEKPRDMATVKGGEGMKGEMVRKDHFNRYFKGTSAYYCGKDYIDKETGKRTGTEIVSMGLQALYEDPAGFCADDPEYAAFIIGLLRS